MPPLLRRRAGSRYEAGSFDPGSVCPGLGVTISPPLLRHLRCSGAAIVLGWIRDRGSRCRYKHATYMPVLRAAHELPRRVQRTRWRVWASRGYSRSTIRRTGRLLAPSMPVSNSTFPALPPQPS
jgi:hypothetical protein